MPHNAQAARGTSFLNTDLQEYSRPAVAGRAARLLATVRAQKPLVQNITNFVAMDITANMLLAIGASPAMVHGIEEVPEFVQLASALVINTGTLSQPWVDSMLVAAEAAGLRKLPWVLDPVGAGATSYRNAAVARLLALKPAIIRGNASEILAVARIAGISAGMARPKGVDSAHGTAEAEDMAMALARHQNCIVAATGAVDVVTDGACLIRLGNGDALMTQVTALGCALSAMAGAFAAATPDMLEAAVAAIAVYGVAGEMAARQARGPGSFRVAFLDCLHNMGEDDLKQWLKVLA